MQYFSITPNYCKFLILLSFKVYNWHHVFYRLNLVFLLSQFQRKWWHFVTAFRITVRLKKNSKNSHANVFGRLNEARCFSFHLFKSERWTGQFSNTVRLPLDGFSCAARALWYWTPSWCNVSPSSISGIK